MSSIILFPSPSRTSLDDWSKENDDLFALSQFLQDSSKDEVKSLIDSLILGVGQVSTAASAASNGISAAPFVPQRVFGRRRQWLLHVLAEEASVELVDYFLEKMDITDTKGPILGLSNSMMNKMIMMINKALFQKYLEFTLFCLSQTQTEVCLKIELLPLMLHVHANLANHSL